MKLKSILAISALLTASLVSAQPSGYYIWKNKLTGEKVCEPTMSADKWVRESGPYEDSNCKFKLPD